jgi:hypothetical protein
MVGITERNKMKNELAGIGYSLKYIDEWQPKTTLYRHKPSYSVSGKISEDVGTTVNGVPGNPDYVLRKSKIGLFPWPPSDTCECEWCQVKTAPKVVEVTSDKYRCDSGDCDYIATSESHSGKLSSLRMHKRRKHK